MMMLLIGSDRPQAAGYRLQAAGTRKTKGLQLEACGRQPVAFTLIEIMVSVAILSIGLMFILQGQANIINNMRVAENNLKATHEAESRMAQARIRAKEDPDMSLSGLEEEFESGDIKFEWEIRAEPVQDSDYLEKVEASMFWKEGRREGSIPLVTYLRKSVEETAD